MQKGSAGAALVLGPSVRSVAGLLQALQLLDEMARSANSTRRLLDNFYLSPEQLENSPSRKDGIDRDTEAELRSYGCSLVQEAGILLAFPQAVMATGQVLLHRFYCKRSMKAFNVKKLAATALWQGAKLEEVPEVSGHPRELLNKVMVAVDRAMQRRETPEGRKLSVLDLHGKEADEFRRSLIRYEMEMLKAFGFITHVEHPHKLLLNYCQVLGLDDAGSHEPEQEPICPEFLQEAWNVANDSLRTTLCVRYKGSVVACGIIFYTARKLKVPLPESPPWYALFGAPLQQIYEVAATLHQLYRAQKPRFIPVCHQLLPSKPPTPALQAAQGEVGGEAGATPLLGRPGRPLDPSVRRLVGDASTRAAGATPGQAAAVLNGAAASAPVAGSSTPAAPATTSAPPSAAPSPSQLDAPGSARKRSRSRSPRDEDSRKRQQRDGSAQLGSQQQHASSRGEAPSLRRGDSAAADKDGDSRRDRERERDGRSGGGRSSLRSRSRSRDRDRERERDRHRGEDSRSGRRRSRSRSREGRGHGGSRSGRPDSGRPDSRHDSRHDRERDRERSRPDDRDRHHKHRDRRDARDGREGRPGDGSSRGVREQQQQRGQQPLATERPAGSDRPSADKPAGDRPPAAAEAKKGAAAAAAAGAAGFPPPPSASAAAAAAGDDAAAAGKNFLPPPAAAVATAEGSSNAAKGAPEPGSAPQQQQRSKENQPAAAGPAAGRAAAADASAAPKPKPVAVRKRPSATAAAGAVAAAPSDKPGAAEAGSSEDKAAGGTDRPSGA